MTINRPRGTLGPKFDTDRVVQQEADELRLNAREKAFGWFVSNTDVYSAPTSAAQTASRLVFSYLTQPERYYALDWARIDVTTASASQTLKLALYHLKRGTQSTLTKVPGSDVTFSTTATGTLTQAFQKTVLLQPNVIYFLATIASSATPTFNTIGANPRVSIRYLSGQTSMPATASIVSTTKAENISPILVTLLSEDAKGTI